MKTFALLAAILLLALQAQSDPLPATVEEASAQEQMEEVDPITTISITGEESSDLRDAGLRAGVNCYCRRGGCNFRERRIGTCLYRGIYYNLCCR
uniref:Neutrophil antibiotic peptide NP-1-like n=1 Tax=Castor canadensis TaxID=51338 RepID=A0A8C0ZQ11_CASCN|nr:neutrophil antibiotic peptide NP-1-like [Castor canadensis]